MIDLAGIAIQDKIYESANSLVYRGITDDGSAIVIKMLKQDYPSPQELTRYRQEYQIARSLNLEGVVKVYSQQDYQRTLVILLEDFGGESLDRWMQKRPEAFCPMPLPAFLRLAIKLAEILGRIHADRVIHKDINPGNIVLNLETGVVKIIDFGISTQFNRTNPTFKSLHLLEGTPAYVSPEQTGRMNRMLDYRTDFYSLGVTFYELLTGQLPFPATDLLELVHCHLAKLPIPPHELNATIPQPISDLILKLMAKNAEDRYQSAWGIKADLECCDRQLAETGRIDAISLGLQDVSERFHISQKLYGRAAEIAALLAAFDRVAGSGAVGEDAAPPHREMMLISGDAGIGKTALVRELYKPIAANQGYFISGKFNQFGRNVPYSAIVDALRKLVRQLLGEPNERVQQWRSRLLAALGSNGQIIIDVIPEVELIIGKQQPLPEVGATEAQNRFNLTFQRFVRAFCAKEHPLVIFLDDLQWIDAATLKLIELISLDEQTKYLFFIGAYRDNEVTPTHPLMLTLEKLQNQGAVIQEIVLTPLTLAPLSQLLAETLHHHPDAVRLLAQAVARKTEGNPFFVGEFLKLLYDENLLTFDARQLNWQWNLAEIEDRDITENVVELLLCQLQKLPEATQQILCIAACVGAEFDLETLAIVCKKSRQSIFQGLLAAIQSGLIQPLSDLDEDLLIQEYKFSHDRVQQAADASIDESQKQAVHLQIGRNLLEKTSPEQRSDRLFEIADRLDRGIELVNAQPERTEIARLNLMAARKAKGAIAYSMAGKYLATGRKWLAASSWQTNYDLTLKLYLETIEIEYLSGNYERVEYWAEIVIQKAKTILDTVKVYDVKIQTDIAQNQRLKAIKTGLQVLQQLGIGFPETPSQSDIQLELDAITSFLGNKQIEDLIHSPEMTVPDKLAAMQILSRISPSVRFVAPDLLSLLLFKQVSLSVEYGNGFVSPFVYALCGFTLCKMGNIESGYKFGRLALSLLSQPNTHSLKSRTLNVVNFSIIHWKEHIREILKPLLEGYQSGLETGDLEFAAYCARAYCTYSLITGKELLKVESEMTAYGKAIRQIKQEAVLTSLQIFQQSTLNLMGCSIEPTRLIGELYNVENGLLQHEAIDDGVAIFYVYFNKLFLCYLFSEYTQAVENSTIASSYLAQITGTAFEPLYYFYSSLARLTTYPTSNDQSPAETLEKIAASQEKMEHWSRHAPMNYLHKYYLVEAERSRVLGHFFEAEEFYERAILGARNNYYIQEEALSYELAAKHYLARGREKIAQTYMKEAHYCYERWGATAKVKDLETRYPQFFIQKVASTSTHTTAGNSADQSAIAFDLAAVMKASQAISREIETEPLLRSLMQILIENAGAQTGYLILENCDGEWLIEASCKLNESENVDATQVLQSIPMANHLPESIVQYVIRTQEPVILNDATREESFIYEPYIQQHQPKSVCCLPLLNQAKLVGVMYLENQLAVGAFTPERSQVLNLLSTQAAIAIENAKLYSKLRANESKIAQFLEAVPVGIAIVDAAGRPYYANQLGNQLIGKETDPAVSPEQISEVYQFYVTGTEQLYPTEKLPLFRALLGERTRNDDIEIRQNNATIPVEAWGTPVYDERGNIIYAIVVFQDITERKCAEKLLADYNQILEQQVAERTAALQCSEAKFRNIFENSQVGIFRIRLGDGLVLDANQRLANLFGYDSPDEVIGIEHSTAVYVNPNDRESAIEFLKQHGELQNFEAQLRKRDGTVFWALSSCRLNAADGCTEGIIADISDRKQAEAALQASETELQTLFAAIPDSLCVVTAEGQIIKTVDPDRLNKPIEAQNGKTVHQIFEKERADEFIDNIQQVLRTQQMLTVEYSMVLNGRQTWFSARIAPIRHERVMWLARDITLQKQAEAASIIEERNRMAREIHDTLAQTFTGILAQVGAANQVLTDDLEATQAHLDLIEELARTGLTEARRSVVALRPQLLEEGSLQSALHRLIAQIRAAAMDTTLYYEIEGAVYALPPEVESNLLRMGQEALTNAIKHANADEIRVELVYDRDRFCLRVKDNGLGFGVGSIPSSKGFGLLGMSERAERIGAQLTIRSQPGQGTEIIVTVNL
jgi:PAS domain S-box-containing protein